ncbi:MAG: hypothetical protein LBR07_01325 [Puniceicoccales bacterium]|jgi:protein-tyrosine phosphatase|nr:hypothetical protein [Puniceicoccales bacterium]
MTETILFLCTGNYYRSRFAEALFNWEARRRRARDVRAISRGLATFLVKDFPETLSPDTEAELRARGISPEEFAGDGPRQLENGDLATAARIIALNEREHRAMLDATHPGWAERVEFWNILDVEADAPAAQLPRLAEAVLALLDETVSVRP